VLLFLVAGHAADRYSRQRTIQSCYGAFSSCSILLLALARHGHSAVWPIYAVLLANGVVGAFNGPAARHSCLLVNAEHFANAVTWSSSIFQATAVLGPTFGGAMA